MTGRGPEAGLPGSRELRAEPAMAETDPKTVQDLTAVVRRRHRAHRLRGSGERPAGRLQSAGRAGRGLPKERPGRSG